MRALFTRILLAAYALPPSALALRVSEDDTTMHPRSLSLKLRRDSGSAAAPVDYVTPYGRWSTNFVIGGSVLNLSIDTGSEILFIEAVLHSLDQPVFTLDLGNTSNAVMNLGAIDNSSYSGNLTTVFGSACPSFWCVRDVTFSVLGKGVGFLQRQMAAGKSHFLGFLRTQASYRAWILRPEIQIPGVVLPCESIPSLQRPTMPMSLELRIIAPKGRYGLYPVGLNYRI
ncbi:MAG: hypothetical protein Q9191_001116 [Dirinaria sp. TL-2023a]